MGLKLLLNVLYTVGIMVCLFILYWGFTNKQYAIVLGSAFIAAMLIFLKLRLLKEVKEIQKNFKK
jgi:hypothetical protein